MATSVNFFQPGTEAAIDANAIMRQREMAKMLMQQSMNPQQGQMVSGHYVAPSKLGPIAQIAQALAGRYASDKADERELALGKQIRAQNAAEAQSFMQAMQGTPARSEEMAGPPSPEGGAPTRQIAATPPDQARAIAMALQSQNPTLQGMAPEIMKRQMDAAEFAQALKAAQGGPAAAGAGGAAPPMAGTPGAAAPAGGGSFGLNPAAFALSASPNARAQALGKMVQEANKPQTLAEGGTLVTPGGVPIFTAPKTEAGITSGGAPVPGFQEAQARREGLIASAKAAATDPYAPLVQVNTPDGPRMMTPAQARSMAQGAPEMPAQPPAPAGYRTEGQMKTSAGEGSDPRAYARELAAIEKDLNTPGKVPDAPSRQMLEAEAARIREVQKQYGLPAPPAAPQGAGAGRGGQGGPGIPLQTEEQQAFGKGVATGSAEALVKGQESAKQAASALNTIAEARAAIKGGAFQGSGADFKLNVAKFVNANIPGVNIDPAKVGNTDYLSSTLGAGLLAEAKTLGTNPSNADAKRIEEIVGSIGKDPRAMDKILDWRQAMAERSIASHNSTVDDAEKRGLKSPYDLRVKPPAGKSRFEGWTIQRAN